MRAERNMENEKRERQGHRMRGEGVLKKTREIEREREMGREGEPEKHTCLLYNICAL